jgi:DNA-binding NarL/FixJ family response regulator
MEKIKLAIADDHKLFREGLRQMLRKEEDLEVVIEAADGVELLELLQKNPVDIVLLDLTMPRMDGFEVLKSLRKKAAKCIVVSMHEDGQYILKCIRSGAYGYLLKNADQEELIEAVFQVAEGRKYVPAELSEKMMGVMELEGSLEKGLGAKEKEVLQHLANGLTTKEIANLMFVSTRTVETHRANMMKKMDAKNMAELVSKGFQLKILE